MLVGVLILLANLSSAPVAAHDNDAAKSKACTLRSTSLSDPAIHPELRAVSAQHFHPDHRGGYDAFRSAGTGFRRPSAEPEFPWFDVDDLTHPVGPPAGARIVIALRNEYFVTRRIVAKRHDELGLWKQGEREPRWLGLDLYPDSAVQTRNGEIWAVARGQSRSEESDSPVRLLHIGTDGVADDRKLDVSDWGRDAELALTADDKPALVFLRRRGGRVRLWLSWSLDPSNAILIDEVSVPVSVAKRTQQTGASVSVAPDGDRGLGIAWRPLTGTNPSALGDVPAEVRWLIINPDGGIDGPRRFATVAQQSTFFSGIDGPWPLTRNGLQAASLEGRAFFVWNEQNDVVGVRSTDAVPTPLAPSGFLGSGLQLRHTDHGLELLLFHSSPSLKAFRVYCSQQ